MFYWPAAGAEKNRGFEGDFPLRNALKSAFFEPAARYPPHLLEMSYWPAAGAEKKWFLKGIFFRDTLKRFFRAGGALSPCTS